MIKLALTKGRIEKKAIEILRCCGYDMSDLDDKGRKLLFNCPSNNGDDDLQIVLAKAADVITYVEHGTCDVGFVGRDTIMEMGGDFYEVIDLNFGICRFALAGIKDKDFYAGYGHKVIATKYPNVTKKFFAAKDIDCEIVKIEGSVELAPILGLADAIVDIVETGATLKENGLDVYEDVAYISARCIANSAAIKLKNCELNKFFKKIEAEVQASK
ncbi:MAG: ATP phosphoribosyltransferase [Ruminococcaceae bacterium]|nr:ATP phosphoribosyltransferase [Oscillospiraceae bacterium]